MYSVLMIVSTVAVLLMTPLWVVLFGSWTFGLAFGYCLALANFVFGFGLFGVMRVRQS